MRDFHRSGVDGESMAHSDETSGACWDGALPQSGAIGGAPFLRRGFVVLGR